MLRRALCSLFIPCNSAPGTACEQFSSADLLTLLLQLSVFAFFPHDLLFSLAAADQPFKGGSSHLDYTSACKGALVLSVFSCCSQAGELQLLPAYRPPRCKMNVVPRLWRIEWLEEQGCCHSIEDHGFGPDKSFFFFSPPKFKKKNQNQIKPDVLKMNLKAYRVISVSFYKDKAGKENMERLLKGKGKANLFSL